MEKTLGINPTIKVNKPMTEYLSFSIDKFTFKTATDRLYNDEGIWAKLENNHVRIGLSDFLQQRSGDVAFVELKPVGTEVYTSGEIAVIETIKVNISLTSPVTGKVIQVNSMMETTPEVINQEPYEGGWLLIMQPVDWEADVKRLLTPQAYFAKIKGEAEQETSQA
jgi:glycine cleavage system H protein